MSEIPILVEQLVCSYQRGEPPAVDRLDLIVAPGEIVGLLGPNGAGKTTTLHAILGLMRPTSGSIRIFGVSPTEQRQKALARLNFASVDVNLPSNLQVVEALSVFADLYGVKAPRRRIDELLEQMGLSKHRKRIIGSLSAGEHMRAKICKALLNDPSLLILDEPTLSLDPYLAQSVRDLLKNIQRTRRMSILHTSHNMVEVETFCDRIVFLHRGKKLTEGSPAEVLERFKSRSLDELFIRVATSGELCATPEPGQ